MGRTGQRQPFHSRDEWTSLPGDHLIMRDALTSPKLPGGLTLARRYPAIQKALFATSRVCVNYLPNIH